MTLTLTLTLTLGLALTLTLTLGLTLALALALTPILTRRADPRPAGEAARPVRCDTQARPRGGRRDLQGRRHPLLLEGFGFGFGFGLAGVS